MSDLTSDPAHPAGRRGAATGRWRDPGWLVVGGKGFLGLTKGEAAVLELRAALGTHLKRCRDALAIPQRDVAQSLHTSQSRVAKMEAGDPTVSLDLLVNALVHLGAKKREIALVIAEWPNTPQFRRLDAAYWLSRQDW